MLNRNKIGLSTFFLSFAGFDDFIQKVGSLDIEYLELRADPPNFFPLELDNNKIDLIKRKLLAHEIKPIVHSTIYDVNLASLNPTIRQASVKTTLDCLELARRLAVEILVVHGGHLPSNYPLGLMPQARENLLRSLEELVKAAEKSKIIIGLENHARGSNVGMIKNPDEHKFFLEKTNSRYLKAVLDIGHANLYDLSIEDYLIKIKDFLVEIHLHNNHGTKDLHLPLNQGKIDIKKFLELIQELDVSVPLILEMTSVEDFERSLEFIKEKSILKV